MRRAFGFLTVVGRSVVPDPATLRWFPVAGAVIGLVVGEVWWLAAHLWPRPVAAVLAVIADLAITGLLHVDGLADAADGLLPPLPRQRRLEVMAVPDVGAFGVTAVVAVLAVRVVALAAIHPGPAVAPLLIAGLWCGARTLMAAAVWCLPYARAEGGLASAFGATNRPAGGTGASWSRWLVASAGAAATAVLGAAGTGWSGLAATPVALGAGVAVLVFARRRIGGFTGDVLGAAGMIAESAGLVVAAGRW